MHESSAAACGARMWIGDLLERRLTDAVVHSVGDKDWTAVTQDIRKEAGPDG